MLEIKCSILVVVVVVVVVCVLLIMTRYFTGSQFESGYKDTDSVKAALVNDY